MLVSCSSCIGMGFRVVGLIFGADLGMAECTNICCYSIMLGLDWRYVSVARI